LPRFEYVRNEAEMNNIPLWKVNLGDIFLQLSDHLREYTDYCSNHPNSLILLEHLSIENNDFEKFTTDLVNNDKMVRGLSLLSFIIKPVQRLCKYPLLLRELLKLTDPRDIEYKKLTEAQQKLDVTVGFVNEMQRKAEEEKQNLLNKIIAIEDSIEGGEILELGSDKNRTIVNEGEIYRILMNKGGKVAARKMWLFNNLLLISNPLKGPKRGKKGKMNDSKLDVFMHVKNVTIVDISDSEGGKNMFILKDRSQPNEEITLCTYELESKNNWIKDIRQTVRVYQKQEAYRLKQNLTIGKEQSIALSVVAEQTTRLKKPGESSKSIIDLFNVNPQQNATKEELMTGLVTLITKGLSIPIMDQENAPPPPLDDGNSNWKQEQEKEGFFVPPLIGDWAVYYNDEGIPYFYNIKTNELKWDSPEGSNLF